MRLNGLNLVIDMAVRKIDDPSVHRYRQALILGALREDVRFIPLLGIVHEHLSLTHFSGRWLPGGFIPLLWPGPRMMAKRLLRKATAQSQAGSHVAAFVQLGRACHLIIDMACPVHVNRIIHETDPYEWYVEGHVSTLAALPVPAPPEVSEASELVESLERFTRRFSPDATRSAMGRLWKRLGLREPISRREAQAQAHAIIPVAAAHVAALLRLFLRETALCSQTSTRTPQAS